VAVEEGLGALGRVGLDEAGVRVRQVSRQKKGIFCRSPPITATATATLAPLNV
jgi:hypothetical protein